MSIRAGLQQMGHTLARLMPHDATVQLPGVPGPATENEWGETLPGASTPGPTYPCHAARLSAEDATKAGLSSSAETWRVVIDAPAPITPEMTLSVTLANGETVNLSVTQVSGVERVTALCRRSA